MIQANSIDRGRILILDQDRILAHALAGQLRADGYDVQTSDNLSTHSIHEATPDIVLADLSDRQGNVIESLRELRRRVPEAAVILMTRYGSITEATAATRSGALAYLTKPLSLENLRPALTQALRHRALLADADDAEAGADKIVGRDLRMQKVFDTLDAVADTRTTVLLIGESGTGKSMLARALHARSSRRGRPFVEVSCGALPDMLLESELFGHVKGSFTGAITDKPGRFLSADSGTIFLDEINSAPLSMQVKLLRVLQERAFEPVGSDETRNVDVRCVLASNVDLETLVANGTFRQDLFYRINVVPIRLPPLRERVSDIAALAEHFLKQFARDVNRRILGISPAAIERLQQHRWPGNVRELENVIERAVVLSKRPMLDVDDLPDSWQSNQPPQRTPMTSTSVFPPLPLETALLEPERKILEAALARHNWNRQATAAELEINRTTLYKKMRKHGLDLGQSP